MVHVVGNLRYKSDYNLGYLNNPKVACGTIKNSMLGGGDINVHKRSSFDALDSIEGVEIFSVVRNPFSRALSGYLQKFTGNKELAIWQDFAKRFDLDVDGEISFRKFLECLSASSDLSSEDHHFRPQVYNLHHGFIEPAYIGRFEDFASIQEYLKSREVNYFPRIKARTNSSDKIYHYYDEECRKLVLDIFKEDFEVYGYGESLGELAGGAPILSEQWVSDEVLFK